MNFNKSLKRSQLIYAIINRKKTSQSYFKGQEAVNQLIKAPVNFHTCVHVHVHTTVTLTPTKPINECTYINQHTIFDVFTIKL